MSYLLLTPIQMKTVTLSETESPAFAGEAVSSVSMSIARLKPHPSAFRIACLSAALLASFLLAASVQAQSAACGLTTVRPTVQLYDPPIAKAAHVRGPVVMLVTFATDGSATAVRVISGALMLRGASVNWAKGLVANSYPGPRECPISIQFKADPNPERACDSAPIERIAVPVGLQIVDLQHYAITAEAGCFEVNYSVNPHA